MTQATNPARTGFSQDVSRHALLARSALNLRTNCRHRIFSDKASSPRLGAKREEILMATEVVEPFQVFWFVCEHAVDVASSDPRHVWLKPDTTIRPPEGGYYACRPAEAGHYGGTETPAGV